MWRALRLHRVPSPRILPRHPPPAFRSHLYSSTRNHAPVPPELSAVDDAGEDEYHEEIENLIEGVIDDLNEVDKDPDEPGEGTLDDLLLNGDDSIPPFEDDDATSVGHLLLRDRRRVLKYLRLIELEVPLLAAFRQPFIPSPLHQEPIILRSISYGGENHPATKKAVIVVPISRLGLENPNAIHKFKLLAGARWSPDPPLDAGLSAREVSTLRQRRGEMLDSGHDGHGFFKISHEGFPELQMNLKWCSDTLEQLVSEAKNSHDFFTDVPLDARHIEARARRQHKGDHLVHPGPRAWHRVTIRDFPKEWLPSKAQMRRIAPVVAQRRAAEARRPAGGAQTLW